MKKINNFLYKHFKWSIRELIIAFLGTFIFSFAINTFIVPNHLFNGGVLGISQLFSYLFKQLFNIKMNLVGIINLSINLPLFILAYKSISKTFFRRTVICVILQTIFLTFIPVSSKNLVDELITSVLIGGVLAGIGSGLVLSTSSSMGGTDIVGIAISSKNRKLTVGMISTSINICIFLICGLLFGVKIAIYSILFTVFESIMVDRFHLQNINSTVMIFTKKEPTKICNFVIDEIGRDVTTWEAEGTGTHSKTYISYVALSKYELMILESHIPHLDKDAFIVKDDGVAVYGNFEKKLAK